MLFVEAELSLKKNFFNELIYFCLCWVSLLLGFFSSCSKWVLLSSCNAWASHCGGFSCCRAWVLGCGASVVAIPGLSSTGSIVVAHRLSCSMECGIFLEPGIKPVSPALAGRFFTVEPQGKPLFYLVFNSNFYIK